VLVLGVLGIVMQCFVLGIVAWVLANNDLQEMEAGRMDPGGRDITYAGKIIGMVSVILTIVAAVIWFGFLGVGMGFM
jgi:hypothetical protein